MKPTKETANRNGLLSPAELAALSERIGAQADAWLAKKRAATPSPAQAPKLTTHLGRPAKGIQNPFLGFIGCTTYWGRYPVFALDIIEGVARLDWHDRSIDVGGKSMPLAVRHIGTILETLPVVTTATVMDLLQLGERHARRYVKAMELIIPRMMGCRPKSLYNEMEGIETEPKPCEWEDYDELPPPSPEELAKLHYDLRTLTTYQSTEECETNVVVFPARTKRQDVLDLLSQGVPIKAIARQTGVAINTIRKWRDAKAA